MQGFFDFTEQTEIVKHKRHKRRVNQNGGWRYFDTDTSPVTRIIVALDTPYARDNELIDAKLDSKVAGKIVCLNRKDRKMARVKVLLMQDVAHLGHAGQWLFS